MSPTSKSRIIPTFLTGVLCCLINVCKALSVPWVKDTTKEQGHNYVLIAGLILKMKKKKY